MLFNIRKIHKTKFDTLKSSKRIIKTKSIDLFEKLKLQIFHILFKIKC